MKEVHAVKEADQLRDIPRYLAKHHSQREADVWEFGINVALRISDLLAIRFDDVDGEELRIVEQKTQKTRVVTLNTKAMQIIERRKSDHPDHVYLFQSVSRNISTARPVTRQYISTAFNDVGTIVGVHLNTHSMRKTRGYHLHKSGQSIEVICKMLNHSSPSVTMRYIGIDADDVKKTYTNLVL